MTPLHNVCGALPRALGGQPTVPPVRPPASPLRAPLALRARAGPHNTTASEFHRGEEFGFHLGRSLAARPQAAAQLKFRGGCCFSGGVVAGRPAGGRGRGRGEAGDTNGGTRGLPCSRQRCGGGSSGGTPRFPPSRERSDRLQGDSGGGSPPVPFS